MQLLFYTISILLIESLTHILPNKLEINNNNKEDVFGGATLTKEMLNDIAEIKELSNEINEK